MPHRILVAPDKFKGSLTAPAAAQAIGDGIRDALPDAEIVLRPIADGGDGTAETLHAALGGSWVHVPGVADPLGRPIEARYLWIGADRAVIAGRHLAEKDIAGVQTCALPISIGPASLAGISRKKT